MTPPARPRLLVPLLVAGAAAAVGAYFVWVRPRAMVTTSGALPGAQPGALPGALPGPAGPPDEVFIESVRPTGLVTIVGHSPPVVLRIEEVPLQTRDSLSNWRDLVATMQGQLNALGASPVLVEDGLIGWRTARALDLVFARWPYGREAARWTVRDRGRWWRGAMLIDHDVQVRSGRDGIPLAAFPPAPVLLAQLEASRRARG